MSFQMKREAGSLVVYFISKVSCTRCGEKRGVAMCIRINGPGKEAKHVKGVNKGRHQEERRIETGTANCGR